MKNKTINASFITGLIIGVILTGITAWVLMPSLMINVHKSNLNFDETISVIEESAASTDSWKIPAIHDLQGSLVKAGHTDMSQVKVVELCHPHYAYDVLKDDENKKISAIMPCRIGVYEDKSGQVYIAEMNTKLISKMFGGNIAKVMAIVSKEQGEILKNVLE